MGLTLSSTSELPTLPTAANPTPRGVRGWLQALPLRERIMYGALLTVTLVAIGIYALIGLRLLNASADDSGDANALMLPTATAPTPATVADAEPTGQTVDQAMTAQPTATQRPIITRPEIFDTEQPRPPSPTTPPGTAGASLAPPSALPPASAVVSGEVDLLLYFIDADTDLLVPVTRRVEVAAGTVEAVLIAALIDGPPSRVGLEPVLPATTRFAHRNKRQRVGHCQCNPPAARRSVAASNCAEPDRTTRHRAGPVARRRAERRHSWQHWPD
ncbi:MAG: GerMN domain-containing protein [Chloroflexaceae bacterium]|nr:GerMN domain-containing protein [Chloroflexaceae bacterium]